LHGNGKAKPSIAWQRHGSTGYGRAVAQQSDDAQRLSRVMHGTSRQSDSMAGQSKAKQGRGMVRSRIAIAKCSKGAAE